MYKCYLRGAGIAIDAVHVQHTIAFATPSLSSETRLFGTLLIDRVEHARTRSSEPPRSSQ